MKMPSSLIKNHKQKTLGTLILIGPLYFKALKSSSQRVWIVILIVMHHNELATTPAVKNFKYLYVVVNKPDNNRPLCLLLIP